MEINKHNNFDADHTNPDGIFNNHGQSSPVIIHAECRVKYSTNDKLTPYDCISGTKCNLPFRITIHNYESEALGFDPTIKSEQNYYRFLHLSTLFNMPWGLSVRFRDDDGMVFGAGDIVRLLEERSEKVMKDWKEYKAEEKKRQKETMEKVKVEYPCKVDNNNNDIMEI